MICPKCKAEYRDGYTFCPECDCPLTEALPHTDEPIISNAAPVFLYEAADDFEAEVIIAKLKNEGIFAFKKYQGSDGYNKIFLGRTILGVCIYVSEDDLEKAEEVLSV